MKICLRYAGNRYEASEVLNEGFFKALTNIEKYDQGQSFRGWLSKIMYNASIDYYRANLRQSQMEDLEKADDVGVDAVVEHKLEYDDLLELVQHLTPVYRMVFNLYAIDGYSHEEIAGMLEISTGTSRSNLFKARQKLQCMISVRTHLNSGGNHEHMQMTTINQITVDQLFRGISISYGKYR